MWGHIVQDFPWIIVHPSLDALNLAVTDVADWSAFRDETSDELMLILTRAPLIRSIRSGKVYIRDRLQCFIKCDELGTVVRGDKF